MALAQIGIAESWFWVVTSRLGLALRVPAEAHGVERHHVFQKGIGFGVAHGPKRPQAQLLLHLLCLRDGLRSGEVAANPVRKVAQEVQRARKLLNLCGSQFGLKRKQRRVALFGPDGLVPPVLSERLLTKKFHTLAANVFIGEDICKKNTQSMSVTIHNNK